MRPSLAIVEPGVGGGVRRTRQRGRGSAESDPIRLQRPPRPPPLQPPLCLTLPRPPPRHHPFTHSPSPAPRSSFSASVRGAPLAGPTGAASPASPRRGDLAVRAALSRDGKETTITKLGAAFESASVVFGVRFQVWGMWEGWRGGEREREREARGGVRAEMRRRDAPWPPTPHPLPVPLTFLSLSRLFSPTLHRPPRASPSSPWSPCAAPCPPPPS